MIRRKGGFLRFLNEYEERWGLNDEEEMLGF